MQNGENFRTQTIWEEFNMHLYIPYILWLLTIYHRSVNMIRVCYVSLLIYWGYAIFYCTLFKKLNERENSMFLVVDEDMIYLVFISSKPVRCSFWLWKFCLWQNIILILMLRFLGTSNRNATDFISLWLSL